LTRALVAETLQGSSQGDALMTGSPDPVAGKLSPHATWVRWRIVALLVAFSFLSWFLRVSISVAYNERIKDQLGISPESMGYVYSAFLIVYALLMTPGGWFLDRFGVRTALIVMGVGLTLFGALTGLVGSGVQLLAGAPPVQGLGLSAAGLALLLFLLVRSCMGAFATPMYPASAHAIARWQPLPRRGWANGLVQGAACVGIASTPLLFGTLIDWFDWPQAFLILAVGTGLVSLLWAADATDRPEQHPGVSPAELHLIRAGRPERSVAGRATGGWDALLRNRSLVCLTLSYAAVGYFEYLFFFWMDFYFKDQLHLPDGLRRVYSAIPLLAMGAGMALGGWLSDGLVRRFGLRLGRALVPMVGLSAAAAFLCLGVLVRQPEAIVALFALALGAGGTVEAPTWTTAVELGGRRGGTAAGICNTGGNVGGFIAPIVTPWVALHVSWGLAIGLAALVCLAGVCLWAWVDPRERRDGLALAPPPSG
jgi:ACS family D-galactonate transporter-like MFS transporter